MGRASNWLAELETVPPDIARRLVDPLFHENTALIVGTLIFVLLGVICFYATGSTWYLAGAAATLFPTAWRLRMARIYRRDHSALTPRAWARRAMWGAWSAAVVWGCWGTAVYFEPDKAILIMIIGVHASVVMGGAVRNNCVPIVPLGQAIITEIPTAIACLLSDSQNLNLYAGFLILHIATAASLTKFLHRQTLRLLLVDAEKTMLVAEKSELVGRLEGVNQDLEVVNRYLETMVATDALTGVANRRCFDLTLAREWRRSSREQTPLSLLMLDVDHFKSFNDFYGHPAGDGCLREVVSAAASAIRRPGDLLARYGGEEFAVILPDTWSEGASHIADEILAAIAGTNHVHAASPLGRVSVSIGIACMIPQGESGFAQLLESADRALYEAKCSGRNRAQLAQDRSHEATPQLAALLGGYA